MVTVTGASGHIGGNLVRALLKDERTVRVVLRGDDNEALEGLEVERVYADVRDKEALAAALSGSDIVYHLAAKISIVGDPDGSVRATNVGGARNVAETCLSVGVRRLVHFSSCHAFDLNQVGAIDETAPRPGSQHAAYDQSKAAGEAEVRKVVEKGLDAVIVNPSGVIGPNDFRPSRMGKTFRDLKRRRLPGLVAGGFDFVDVRDVVAGAMAAEHKGRTGESYLLGGHWVGVADLMRHAGEVCGVRAPRMVTPTWLALMGAPFMTAFAQLTGTEPIYTAEAIHTLNSTARLSTAKAERELGYTKHSHQETLEAIYASNEELGV